MMLPDTGRGIIIKPWTYSRDTLPVETRSTKVLIHCGRGRPLRPRAQRKKHVLNYQDALRMLVKLVPPDDVEPERWSYKVIAALRDATLTMLGRLLVSLPDHVIESLYDFAIGILDKLFGQVAAELDKQRVARDIILVVAGKANLIVTIKGG